jgi:glycerophosphoryl diester phosphodiesterase
MINRRQFLAASGTVVAGAAVSPLVAVEPKLPERGLCAHRGVMSTHPENTLPAFEEAIRLGAHMIEFDIQITKDGALVLMHDGTVDRTTDGKGKVGELTWAEIRKLDAGAKKDKRFAGTRIPTFEETLAMMPRNIWLNCHLKGGAALGAATAKVIVQAGRQHQAFLAAEAPAAKAARTAVPGILICNMERQKDTAEYVRQTIEMKASFIQLLGKGDVAAEHVRLLKQNRVRVNYFQVSTVDEVRRLLAAGVDFPLVNDLAMFLPLARELGIAPANV